MKRLKNIIGVLVVLIVLFIGTLIAIPYFFKDQIVQGIRDSANDQIHASFDFEDISLSLLRSFPELQINLKNASIIGIEEFEGIPLYKATQTIANVDLLSVFDKDRIGTISSAKLIYPEVNILTNQYGSSNYDILITDQSASTDNEANYEIDLSKFEIADGQFNYTDELAQVYAQLRQINLDGDAQLRGSKYFIDYNGKVEETGLKAIGINYLNNVRTSIGGAVELDLDQSKYNFIENFINLNDLDLKLDGWVQNQEASVLMDINFESVDDQFRKIWSLIPGVYTEQFAKAKISGLMKVAGYIRGTYDNQKDQLPSFDIKINTNNGTVQYPGIPKVITGINSDVTISSTGPLDQLGIRIPFFKFKIDDEPFEGKFIANHLLSNPDLDLRLNGSIDFKDFSEIVALKGISELTGKLSTDIQVNGRMSDITNKSFQNTLISGNATLTDFKLIQDEVPDITINQLAMNFSPRQLDVSNVLGKLGSTTFNAEGTINNVIAFFVPGQEVTGKVNLETDIIDFNEWYKAENVNDPNATNIEGSADLLPEHFNLELAGKSDMIKYSSYEILNVSTSGMLTNGDLSINELLGSLYGSSFSINGKLNNIINYAIEDGQLTGSINFASNYFNFNPILAVQENLSRTISTDENLEPFIIPENISLSINTDIDRLEYDNLTITDINGAINIANSEARMKDVKAKAFDGEFTLNGGYIAPAGTQPKFDLAYTLDQFDFQKTFEKVNTFKFIAPIGKFIKGNFNSTLKMQGNLTEDLLPDLASLNADGFVETFNGLLADFKPLDLLGQYFSTDDVRKMQLTDTRNSFTVKDGTVTINEFDQKVKDIEFKISGTHSLDQEINYLIKSKVPKELLAKTGITAVVDQGLSTVNTQLNKLGFNINNGKFINLNFILTGTISKPKIEMRVVGMDGETDITDVVTNEIDEAIKTVKDSIKSTVQSKVDSTQRKIEEKRDELLDTAAVVVNQKVDSLKANIKTEIDSLIKQKTGGALPDSLKIKIDSILKKGSGKEIDKVKELLKDFNPLKKKNKKKKTGSG